MATQITLPTFGLEKIADRKKGVLAGKKTYLTGAVTIISAVVAFLIGEVGFSEAFQLIVTAVLGMTIRSGIKAEAKKLPEDLVAAAQKGTDGVAVEDREGATEAL